MKRVPPSTRMKEEMDLLLKGQFSAPGMEDPMRGFLRGIARYILQVHIEAEATEFLGRGHYRRGDRRRQCWRNGYEPKGIQTESGLMTLHVPQVRETHEPFRSPLLKRVGHRTDDLEALTSGTSRSS